MKGRRNKKAIGANTLGQAEVGTRVYTKQTHTLYSQTLLDESFVVCETPQRLKNIELREHQKTIVATLLDIEDTRRLEVHNSDFTNVTTGPVLVGSSATTLSEQFGSGKTIELLALIAERPVPRAHPVHMNTVACGGNTLSGCPNPRFQHEIMRTYTGMRAFIRPNFIIVGSAVVDQWREAISEFTDFSVLVVADQASLRVFQQLFRENKINSYDIVLVKNGQVTGNLGFLGADYENRSYCTIIGALGHVLADVCVARDIYDDFDTIKIPRGTLKLNSLYTYYVSATTRKDNSSTNAKFNSVEELFAQSLVPLSDVIHDRVLFSNFNIRNVPEYTDRSTAVTMIKGYKYVYANPDDNFIRLLGVIGDEATEIMEMLNGDAIGTAAKRLNIETTSAADVFQRVLDQQYDKYRHDQRVLAAVAKFKRVIATLEEDVLTYAEVEAARKALERGNTPQIRAYSILLAQHVDEVEAEYKQALARDGVAITRVIENVKEGACQICQLPLCESDTFIVRCCGLIVCDVCGIAGSHLKKTYDMESRTYMLKGKCANCRCEINPRSDLIFVDKDMNVESLLTDVELPDDNAIVTDNAVVNTTDTTVDQPPTITIESAKQRNPKLVALVDIINGKIPAARQDDPVDIPQLLKGKVNIPQDINTVRKILVFANFDETLKMIEDFLVENGIQFLRLHGTYKEKAAIVKTFRDCGTVLLVNSSQSCAGLNIQFSTDIVLFHELIDKNITGQVVGRGQRIGRTCNLHLHSLRYNNEA